MLHLDLKHTFSILCWSNKNALLTLGVIQAHQLTPKVWPDSWSLSVRKKISAEGSPSPTWFRFQTYSTNNIKL